MEKVFKLQRLLMVIYIVVSIILFIYSLFFLTDFKDLFGLEMKMNQPIADFHDNKLQGFNQMIFFFSLMLLVGIFLLYILEIWKNVPDIFAVVVVITFLVVGSVLSIMATISVSHLSEIYKTLDFQYVSMEGAIEYIPNDRTFVLGRIVYPLSVALFMFFAFILLLSHVLYKKQEGKNE